jgi:hypothetical protein
MSHPDYTASVLDILVWLIVLFALLAAGTGCSTTATVTPPRPVVIEVTCTCAEQAETETAQEQPQEPVVSLIATRRTR